MTKILLSVFTLLLITTSEAQSLTSSPTTITEYNYCLKGYKVQMESGLDMKQGYSFSNLDDINIQGYKYSIKCLIRTAEQEVAALMVIATSPVSGKTYYLCIPHGDKELYQSYYNELASWDLGITKPYAYFMSTELSRMTAKVIELEKSLKNRQSTTANTR